MAAKMLWIYQLIQLPASHVSFPKKAKPIDALFLLLLGTPAKLVF
jgi:hypothetical protein